MQGEGEDRPAKRQAVAGAGGMPEPASVAGADVEEQQPFHDALDDELDDMGVPSGWRECPAIGPPVDRFIPMKVPLGAAFDRVIAPEHRFTVQTAKEQADRMVAGLQYGRQPAHVGLVIDLTNSSRYYLADQWLKLGVQYIKIPCRGRGQTPQPEAVSDLVFEVYRYLSAYPAGMVLIHCTHGFNRTGYMICSYLVRCQSMTVEKAVAYFARKRRPGIYKHYYIRELFKYCHEPMPAAFPLPAQPPWKQGDSPEAEPEDEGDPLGEEGEMHHDDVVGEEVSPGELHFIQSFCMDVIMGEDPQRSHPWFPGSQPVSLDSSNLDLLGQRRYWVTWKADGTRYMLLLMRWGTYLIDRKFAVRRVQMRWPNPPHDPASSPVGLPHHRTLLDGEMVVDHVLDTGKQERRFLAYDCMALNGQPVVSLPWKERYELCRKEVMDPRKRERELIQRGKWNYPYSYDQEPFHVRRKEFWPLFKADSLINRFMTQLSHECDGLILQACDDAYTPGTCPELLKWKFAHMNSVDFRLKVEPAKAPGAEAKLSIELLETRRRKGISRGYKALPGAHVVFPEGENPTHYHLKIIECSWLPEQQAWQFMRERRDKDLPNAYHVYESVARSIQDNIQEGQLLDYVHQVLTLPVYDQDMRRHPGHQHQLQAAQPPQLQQQAVEPAQGEQQPGGQQQQDQQHQQQANGQATAAAGAGG